MFDLSTPIEKYKDAWTKMLGIKKQIKDSMNMMPAIFSEVSSQGKKFLPEIPEIPYRVALNRAYLDSLLEKISREVGFVPNLAVKDSLFERNYSSSNLYSKRFSMLESEDFSLSMLIQEEFLKKYGTTKEMFLRWLVEQGKTQTFLQRMERASDKKIVVSYLTGPNNFGSNLSSFFYGTELRNVYHLLLFANALIEFAVGGSPRDIAKENEEFQTFFFNDDAWKRIECGQEYEISTLAKPLSHLGEGKLRLFKNRSASLSLRKETINLLMLSFEKIKVFF